MSTRILFLLGALLLFCYLPICQAASLINVPLNPNISDFNTETYRFIHRLLNKRVISGIPRGSLPFTGGQIATFLKDTSEKHQNGEIELSSNDLKKLNSLLAFYSEAGTNTPPERRLHLMSTTDESTFRLSFDLSAVQHERTRLIDNESELPSDEGNMHTTTFHPHIYGQVNKNFAFSVDMAYRFLYGDIFDDIYVDESKYRQLEGELKNRTAINNYIKFKFPWFELQYGNDNLQWGPGYHGNLTVSPNPIAINMLKLNATYNNITYTSFTGELEDMSQEINEKYISGHRAEGYFWDRFGFGISEVVVYGNRFEIGYVNPINIYLINEQTISRADGRVPGSGDNVIASVDLRLRPIDNFEIYAELMVDDGNPAASFHHWDTKFGILGGIYLTDPFGLSDSDLHFEYAFINQYAYTHINPFNVYKHFTSVIGHHIGSDADNLWIAFRRRFTDKLETIFEYELERHGEGNVDKHHPEDAPKDDVWTPLSGLTASEHRVKIGFNWVVIGHYSIYGNWTRIWRRNIENMFDVNESANEIVLKFLYRI